MGARVFASLAVVCGLTLHSGVACAEGIAVKADNASAGHVTGFGGVFVKSRDPKALADWYRDVLGLKIESWGGAMLRYDAPEHPPVVVWNAFPETGDCMAPSKREFMLNFGVDDMDALLAKLAAKGVVVLKRDDTDPSGRFAWIVDPDGTKIELWQAPKNKP